jgi:hypothetical protein
MARIRWTNSAGGDFATASDWSTGNVPGPADRVAINASGAYTVTSSSNESVLTLSTAATATLAITGGPNYALHGGSTFTMTEGTVTEANAGTITVDHNSNLIVGGTINNIGSIVLNSTNNDVHSQILINQFGTTLKGAGHVTLSGNGNAGILSLTGTLTNADNTISGTGVIDSPFVNQKGGTVIATGYLTVESTATNAGLMKATGNGTLFEGAGILINSGTLQATDGGTVKVLNGTVDSSAGGVIEAIGAGSQVVVQADLIGGTLRTATGGIMSVDGDLDGTHGHPVTIAGQIDENQNSLLELRGTINNTGTILITSGMQPRKRESHIWGPRGVRPLRRAALGIRAPVRR